MRNITSRLPRYWNSEKGRVIKAIVYDRAFTREDICEVTGLSEKSLNRILSELDDLRILENKNGEYRVALEIWKEYRPFFNEYESEKTGKSRRVKQENLVKWIEQWRRVKNLDFSLESKHFFLEGRNLDEISKELICKARSEVLVVNPFVVQCALSDTLREASAHGVIVRLITRPPKDKNEEYRIKKQEYHSILKNDGVLLTYNKQVHAKLIVIDRIVAILSSMNFYSGSSGGAVWETGIISFEETVVGPIVNSILELLERPETKEI